jgi:O-antigen/teichoic acid export membrane protein
MDEKKTIKKNIVFAILAQMISLILSVLIILVVPKIIGIEDFSYWQLFLFYINYLGFLHFGLNDGIYLKLGGKYEKEIDRSLITGQFWISLGFQLMFTLIIIVLAIVNVQDPGRRFVWIATALYLPLVNSNGFIGYIFQAINRTSIYSIAVILDKLVIFISLFILAVFNNKSFELYVSSYIISRTIAVFFLMFKGKSFIFSNQINLKNSIIEIFENIKIGILLMVANIVSALILGIGRKTIDLVWGLTTFGKVSFAISLANFFLLFVSQVSMVLFPVLRRSSKKQLEHFYENGRNLLGVIFYGVLLLYMPVRFLLELWLPQYNDSLLYLGLILPICTYDGKMQILCNTYFKVLRKEKLMMYINMISLLVSTIFCIFGGYVLHNIYLVIFAMVFAIAVRGIVSELYLAKLMNIRIIKNIFQESLLLVLFVSSTWFLGTINGFILYSIAYGVFILINRINIVNGWNLIRRF